MKRVYSNLRGALLAVAMVVVASCQSDKAPIIAEHQMRTIEVCTVATRTTIAYEGSDVSHLEWCEGDKVAYVTDVAGDTFKSAEMKGGASGWAFTAEIPAEAQNIYVIYPVGDNEGKTLMEAKASLNAAYVQVAGAAFDGSQLPMMAQSAVSAGSRVDVVYECVASVLRFTIKAGEGHETETLKGLTLSANEPLAGDYTLDATTSSPSFAGAATTIDVEYKGTSETGEELLLSDNHYIYVVIPSAEYTGVDVVVETDVDSYYWSDGAMSLSHPERRLYRVTLDLDASEGAPEPAVPHFVPVLKNDEIIDDGVYLLAVNIDGKYYVTNNQPTDTSNYYWVEGVEVSFDDSGVIYSEDVMNYTWSITKRDGGYEFYSANMLKQGTYGVLLVAQGGSGMFISGEDGYEGKAWFVPTTTADGWAQAQQPRRYWDIELDGAGKAVIRNKYDRGVDMFPCYKYCTSHKYFTLCFEGGGEDKADIQILKLNL